MNYSKKIKKKLSKCIAASQKPKNIRNPCSDFTRDRKLSYVNTFNTILSMGGNSLGHELLEKFNYSTDVPTSSAFVQARNKILSTAFIDVFNSFTMQLKFTKKFRGYQLLAIDGTNLNLFRNPNDTDTYVNNKKHKGHNAMHLSAFYDLQNHIYTDVVNQPTNKIDERGALIKMLPNISSNTIIIADRGYESYNIFAHIENINSNYLFRVKDIGSNGILSGFNLPNEEFDCDITVNISNKQNKSYKSLYNYKFSPSIARFDFSDDDNPIYTLTFRVVRIKLESGKYESIITNLQRNFTVSDVKKLYFMRWGIETSFRQLKYAIGLSNFHAKKRDSVIQEIYARLILYNFCEYIVQKTILPKMATKHTYIINFTRAVQVCRKYLRLPQTVSFDVEALICKFLNPVRIDRTFTRLVKHKGFTNFVYRIA